MLADDSKADAIQRSILQNVTVEQRLRMVLKVNESLRNLVLAGSLSARPGIDATGSSRELVRIWVGLAPRT